MLHGVDYSRGELSTYSLLEKLNKSLTPFTLTGSRYFGTATPSSDWDFYTEASPATVRELEALGYKLSVSGTYDEDCNTISVYRTGNGLIHVQLVRDAGIKTKVQSYLKMLGVFKKGARNKITEHNIWAATYAFIGFTGVGR